MSAAVSLTPANASLTPLRLQRRIEADLAVRGNDQTLRLNGDVFLNRSVVPNGIKSALRNCPELQGLNVRFDPTSQRYALSAEVSVLGARIPVSATTAVRMDGPTVVLRDTRFNFPLSGLDWVANIARDQVVKVLNEDGIGASRTDDDIRINANHLMHNIGVLPRWAGLANDQPSEIRHDRDGNIRLRFGQGGSGTPDGVSHITAQLDRPASQRVLRELFESREYRVSGATFSAGEARVSGRAAIAGTRDAINGIAGILLALGGANPMTLHNAQGPAHSDLQVPLDMTVTAQGDQVTIRPSMRLAVPKVAESLTSDRVQPTVTDETVSIPASSLLPDGRILHIAITPDGLEAAAELNIDTLLGENMLQD